MKKILKFILTVFLIFILSINSHSIETTEEIWDNIDNTTKEYLNDLDIDEVTFEEIFDLTPTRVIEFIIDLAFNKTESVLSRFVLIFIVLIINAISSSFLNVNTELNKVIDSISMLIIASYLMSSLSRTITDAVVGIQSSNIFINSYLPIMVGLIVASKNPALAVTYNSYTVFLSNIISLVTDKFIMPIISIIFSFNIISSFSGEEYQLKITKILRKLVIIVTSLFSTIFTGLLSAQGILAISSDNLALKGIKFVSGAFIPVVGGNISEVISSAISSFVLMKSTLGVFIIIVIILINLPVMIELLIWYLFLYLCSVFSSLLKLDNITSTLESLSSTISLLNIIVFFITFILVVTTGVIIIMGK